MGAMSGWQRWRRLPRNERAATISAALLIPVFAVAVRLTSLPRVLRWIGCRVDVRRRPDPGAAIDAMARSIERAAVHSLLPGACLSRSLALMYLLARRGITTELRLGARISGGGLDAHAWIEHDGVALNDPAGLRAKYAVLPQKQTAA